MLCYVMFYQYSFLVNFSFNATNKQPPRGQPKPALLTVWTVCPYIKYIQKYEYCRKIQYDICKNKINTGKIMLQC